MNKIILIGIVFTIAYFWFTGILNPKNTSVKEDAIQLSDIMCQACDDLKYGFIDVANTGDKSCLKSKGRMLRKGAIFIKEMKEKYNEPGKYREFLKAYEREFKKCSSTKFSFINEWTRLYEN